VAIIETLRELDAEGLAAEHRQEVCDWYSRVLFGVRCIVYRSVVVEVDEVHAPFGHPARCSVGGPKLLLGAGRNSSQKGPQGNTKLSTQGRMQPFWLKADIIPTLMQHQQHVYLAAVAEKIRRYASGAGGGVLKYVYISIIFQLYISTPGIENYGVCN
jgi:hypothetical protein